MSKREIQNIHACTLCYHFIIQLNSWNIELNNYNAEITECMQFDTMQENQYVKPLSKLKATWKI